jgi:putative transposase
VPTGLKRFHESGQTHFVTFSCYHRRPFFTTNNSRQTFETALERVRATFDLCVYGYVVMPEHVHLLISEPTHETLADALKSLKQGLSRRLIGEAEHFWQTRYYDFNIRNRHQFSQKLLYLHHNPVKRGLCANPEDWEWCSFCHYATGTEGRVEIESDWTARRRELFVKLPLSSQTKGMNDASLPKRRISG